MLKMVLVEIMIIILSSSFGYSFGYVFEDQLQDFKGFFMKALLGGKRLQDISFKQLIKDMVM